MNNEIFIDSFKCAHWVMDIGKVNAFGHDDIHDLNSLLDKCEAGFPNEIRVLSIESHKISPGKLPIFCAGANQKERKDWTSERICQHLEYQRSVVHRLSQIPVYVICCVDGIALGLGAEFCIAADYVLASPNAEFGFPEKGLGILPGAGGYSWAHHLARDKEFAQKLIQNCIRFDRDIAQYLGIVDVCCSSAEFGGWTRRIAQNMMSIEPKNQSRKKRYQNIDDEFFNTIFREEQAAYEQCLFI